MTVLKLTLTLLAILTVIFLALLVATVIRRALRERSARRSAMRRAHLREQTVVALGLRRGTKETATAALRAAGRWHHQEVLDIFTSVATTLGGEYRETVTDLSATLGLTNHLIAGLYRTEASRRVAAVEIIGLLGGADHSPALRLAMRDSDERVRVAAARAYLATSPATAASAIVRMLHEEPPHVAGELAELLRTRRGLHVTRAVTDAWDTGIRSATLISLISHTVSPAAALGLLIAATRSPDPALRRAGVIALASIPTELTLTALADVTADPDPSVRALAVTALGVMAGPTTIPLLIAALDDPAWAVRHRAAAALASLPDGTKILAALLGQAPAHVTTAITTALQEQVATGGLLSALVDPAHAEQARRAVRSLATRPEMVTVLQAAAIRYPDASVRAALSGLVALLPHPAATRLPALPRTP